MLRLLTFIYGVFCYLIFLGVFVYSIGFLGNIFVSNSIDANPRGPVRAAVAVNLGLLTIFALQHSVMARPAFKRWWTRFVPEPAERATYVLFSSIAMILLFMFWRPIGGTVWDVTDPAWRSIILAFYFVGWGVLFIATCLIDHFDLFGLRQVWLHLRGKPYTPLKFKTPGFYAHVRHPIYVGWLMIFWFTPTMSMAHLLFAVVTTAYILIAIKWEESDLINALGDTYRDYKARVPALIPFGKRKAKQPADADSASSSVI